MRRIKTTLFSMAVIVGLIGVGITPAHAADVQDQDAWRILNNLTSRSSSESTAVLNGVANISLDNVGLLKLESKLNSVGVEISTQSGQSIQIDSALGSLSVDLPFSKSASDGHLVTKGVLIFDNRNGSSSVPVIKNDGSLQLTTIIQNGSAPTNFDYQFNTLGDVKIIKCGNALLLLRNGKFAGAVAPAWAKDANGKSVPTHYMVNGRTVTQVVEHTGGNFTYPIVADPWLGLNLFSSVSLASWVYRSQPVVNLDLSAWGWAVYLGFAQGGTPLSFVAGQAILDTAGWDEAWGKGGTIRAALDKPSQRQQFSCHALGAIAAGQWNLEKGRPNGLNGNWGAGVAFHHCNWKFAEGSESD